MNRQLLAVLVVALMTSQIASAYDEVTNPSTMVLLAHRYLTAETANNAGEIGMWEYVYDFYGNGVSQMARWGLYGYDPTAIVNQSPISAGWSGYGPLNQQWNLAAKSNHLYSSFYTNFTTMGSYAGAYVDEAKGMYGDLDTWVVPTVPVVEDYGIVNTWHAPADYAYGNTKRPGDLILTGERMGVVFEAGTSSTPINGLLHTFRLVHPNSPGDVTWWSYTFNNGVTAIATIQGPAVPPPEHPDGDVDRDFDVDVDDIDALCDFLRGEDPVTGYRYDLSDDGENPNEGGGVVDMDDLDYLVHYAVETTVGDGTEYGDFNLDGVVDTTDLTRLATNYGADDWGWDDGNANRNIDTNIDNTDLTILATYYGFGEPDTIPEPATMALLALGGAALLRRRRA